MNIYLKVKTPTKQLGNFSTTFEHIFHSKTLLKVDCITEVFLRISENVLGCYIQLHLQMTALILQCSWHCAWKM